MRQRTDSVLRRLLRAAKAVLRFAARVTGRVFSTLLCIVVSVYLAHAVMPGLIRDMLGFRATEQVTDTVLREELIAISELATYEFTYVNHVEKTNQPQLAGYDVLLTSHWFAFDYHGVIKAGFDLEKIDLLWIDSAERTVGIYLPEAAVLSNDIFVDMSTYEDRNNLCNPLKPAEVLDYLYSRKEPELEKALSQGLLEKADENARRLISMVIEGRGYSAVFVN